MDKPRPRGRLWRLLGACLVPLAGFLQAATGRADWEQDEFVLGTFWDPCLSRVTAEPYPPDSVRQDSIRFLRAREAHFNLITGTQQEPVLIHPDLGGMRYALYIAAKTGLRYLVADWRIRRYREVMPFDLSVAQAIGRDYRLGLDSLRRRALYGYHLGDEPCVDHKDPERDCAANPSRFRSWVGALRQVDSERLIYLNLLNIRGHDERLDGTPDEEYFRSYFGVEGRPTAADVVSTDDYPFSIEHGFNQWYYENLETMRRVAGTRPLWVYPMSSSTNYQEATTWERMQFLATCPLAYGAKGLIFFAYENPEWTTDWVLRDSPVIDCDHLTPRYFEVQRLNGFISAVVGPMIMRAEYLGTFHSGVTPWGERMEAKARLPSSAASLVLSADNPNLLFGEFRDQAEPGTWYLLVVNKSLSPQRSAVTLKRPFETIEAAPRIAGFHGVVRYTTVRAQAGDGKPVIEVGSDADLGGGEAMLFRLR